MRTIAAVCLLPIIIFEGVIIGFVLGLGCILEKYNTVRLDGKIPSFFDY